MATATHDMHYGLPRLILLGLQHKMVYMGTVPEAEVVWVRDSTGVITAKLLAEKDNPRADLVWGLAATSLMILVVLEADATG